jgi:hypothetical protein
MLRAQKVFVAEGGVLAHGNALGVQSRPGQNPRVETPHFHWAPKGSFQMFYKIRVHAVSPR